MKKSINLTIFALFALLVLFLWGCSYIPPASDAQPFTVEEVAHIFALTEEVIFDTFGEPLEDNTVSFYGIPACELVYSDYRFCIEQSSGFVYYIYQQGDAFPPPRGLSLGMKIDDLIPLFACEGDETLYEDKENGAAYRLLYGSYAPKGSYGVVFYEGNSPILVEYCFEGCIFAIGIRNNAVAYFEYTIT